MSGLTIYMDSGRRETFARGVKKFMAKAKLGSGTRFKALKKKLAARGARTPGALASWIGRKKYGAKRFAKLSAKGRK